MNNTLEKIAESKFMQSLEKLSVKLSSSAEFDALSNGMGGSMGIIMIGAVIQIILAIGTNFFGLDPNGQLHGILSVPYTLTMGLLGLFLSFNLANAYAERLGMRGITAGITSIVSFILVAAPLQTVTVGETTFPAINIDNLGAGSMFIAIVIGFLSVRISKVAIDRGWVIKMPDVIPEGILNSFNSIIPTAINIIIWYGLTVIISTIGDGTMTLGSLITTGLSIPMGYLVSVPGMFLIIVIQQLLWFFGIHGTGIVFNAIAIPYIAAYTTNAELAAAGEPLIFSPIFLFTAASMIGGTGNTLPLVLLGLKSESEQIKSISRASLAPGLFGINEPVVFGYPIMYNPILFIPYVLNPLLLAILMYFAYTTGIIGLPYVLILTTLPIFASQYMATFDWRNIIMGLVFLPIVTMIWYPFFKVYEKQTIEEEERMRKQEEALQVSEDLETKQKNMALKAE